MRELSRRSQRMKMGEEGLEPSHLAVPDPKSGASTRSATRPTARRLEEKKARGPAERRQARADVRRCLDDSESGGNRTHNLWIKSPLLCQLSYAPVPSPRGKRRGFLREATRAVNVP